MSVGKMSLDPTSGDFASITPPEDSSNNIETAFQKQLNLNEYYKSTPAARSELYSRSNILGGQPVTMPTMPTGPVTSPPPPPPLRRS